MSRERHRGFESPRLVREGSRTTHHRPSPRMVGPRRQRLAGAYARGPSPRGPFVDVPVGGNTSAEARFPRKRRSGASTAQAGAESRPIGEGERRDYMRMRCASSRGCELNRPPTSAFLTKTRLSSGATQKLYERLPWPLSVSAANSQVVDQRRCFPLLPCRRQHRGTHRRRDSARRHVLGKRSRSACEMRSGDAIKDDASTAAHANASNSTTSSRSARAVLTPPGTSSFAAKPAIDVKALGYRLAALPKAWRVATAATRGAYCHEPKT